MAWTRTVAPATGPSAARTKPDNVVGEVSWRAVRVGLGATGAVWANASDVNAMWTSDKRPTIQKTATMRFIFLWSTNPVRSIFVSASGRGTRWGGSELSPCSKRSSAPPHARTGHPNVILNIPKPLSVHSMTYITEYGSAASRSPSPRRLKPSTAMMIKSAGAMIQGVWPNVRRFCASCISKPQLTMGR